MLFRIFCLARCLQFCELQFSGSATRLQVPGNLLLTLGVAQQQCGDSYPEHSRCPNVPRVIHYGEQRGEMCHCPLECPFLQSLAAMAPRPHCRDVWKRVCHVELEEAGFMLASGRKRSITSFLHQLAGKGPT